MSFLIKPLPETEFSHLFTLSQEELAQVRALRVRATTKPGFPCRVSLADAEVGEEVILTHFEHHAVETPFRASHAIYVRAGARAASLGVNEVPEAFRSRTFSLRGYDSAGMLAAANLAEGNELARGIETMLAEPSIAYLHLHFAKPGCYAARVDRI
jgi:hypothetical protein